MKSRLRKTGKILLIFGIGLSLAGGAMAAETERHPRKIVVFQETFVNAPAQSALLRKFGATIIKPLNLIDGMAVYLPPQAEKALLGRSEILRIDDDLVVYVIAKSQPPPQPQEILPWGIDRINAELCWPTTTGLSVKTAIMDTGIDLDHLDLRNNIKGQINTINPLKTANDDNGHGTHVGGTVAAIDNEIGVIGVGPQVSLYAVKVLSKTGSGWLSDIIEGLDWCINNKMQVINMSFGSSSDNQSFRNAIVKTYQAGIVLVAAAGNNGASGGAITYPAKYSEVIAVSAIGQDNKLASFSSYGPEIDLAAPGVNINSTYNNGYYKILNGTSMAAPHVTGSAALVLTTSVGTYDLDGDGIWDPTEVKNKLEAMAEPLPGLTSYEQGAGLVRPDSAIK